MVSFKSKKIRKPAAKFTSGRLATLLILVKRTPTLLQSRQVGFREVSYLPVTKLRFLRHDSSSLIAHEMGAPFKGVFYRFCLQLVFNTNGWMSLYTRRGITNKVR